MMEMSETKLPAIIINVQCRAAHIDWMIGITRDIETGSWEGHYRFRREDDSAKWTTFTSRTQRTIQQAIKMARDMAGAVAAGIISMYGKLPTINETEFPLDADMGTCVRIFEKSGNFWVGRGKSHDEAMRNKEAQKAFDNFEPRQTH